MTGLAVFLLVVAPALPAALPFFVIADPQQALRASNALLVVLLFVIGWRWGRHIEMRPWLVRRSSCTAIGVGARRHRHRAGRLGRGSIAPLLFRIAPGLREAARLPARLAARRSRRRRHARGVSGSRRDRRRLAGRAAARVGPLRLPLRRPGVLALLLRRSRPSSRSPRPSRWSSAPRSPRSRTATRSATRRSPRAPQRLVALLGLLAWALRAGAVVELHLRDGDGRLQERRGARAGASPSCRSSSGSTARTATSGRTCRALPLPRPRGESRLARARARGARGAARRQALAAEPAGVAASCSWPASRPSRSSGSKPAASRCSARCPRVCRASACARSIRRI